MQEDGDGLLQNIVTNFGMGSRKGLTDGLREIIKVENERALDVGPPRRGTGTFKVRKPEAPEGGSDVTVRESLDELTLRAEEVNTLEALTNVNHVEPDRRSSLLVDAFCQALYKGTEGEDLEEMYDFCNEMSTFWAMRAAKDRKKEFYDPAREEDISRRGKTRLEMW